MGELDDTWTVAANETAVSLLQPPCRGGATG